MKEYVRPEMNIDLFEENSGLATANSNVDCDVPGCTINFSYGGGEDPWGIVHL